MKGCQYCNGFDPHENVNVSKLYESNKFDVKLFKCKKCASYFELRGDDIVYMDQKYIDMAYHGAAFNDKGNIQKIRFGDMKCFIMDINF